MSDPKPPTFALFRAIADYHYCFCEVDMSDPDWIVVSNDNDSVPINKIYESEPNWDLVENWFGRLGIHINRYNYNGSDWEHLTIF